MILSIFIRLHSWKPTHALCHAIILMWGLLCMPTWVQAMPAIEKRLDVILPVSSANGQSSLAVFRDHEDDKVVWWIPYEFGFARQPGTGRLWLSWFARGASPRLTYAVELKPMGHSLQQHVQSEIKRRLGSPDLRFRAITLEELSLQVKEDANMSFLFRGEWRGVTSMIPWVLPETVPLSADENGFLTSLSQGSADGLAFAVNLLGRFEGVLEPKRYLREFDPECLREALDASLPGGEYEHGWSSSQFYAVQFKIESTCVIRTHSFGTEAPELAERVSDWESELITRGILIKNNNVYRVASANALQVLLSQSPIFEKRYPAGRGSYPVSFGALTFRLVPR